MADYQLTQADIDAVKADGTNITATAAGKLAQIYSSTYPTEADFRSALNTVLASTAGKATIVDKLVEKVNARMASASATTPASGTTPSTTATSPTTPAGSSAGSSATPTTPATPAATTPPPSGTPAATPAGGAATTPTGTPTGTPATTPAATAPATTTPAQPTNSAAMFSASVDINYSRKWGFDMTASSKVTTKIVAIPAPQAFLDALEDARAGLTKRQQ